MTQLNDETPTQLSPTAATLAADADDRLAALLAISDAHADGTLGDAWKGRRVADALAHLHAWHGLFLGWLEESRAGEIPAYPAHGYTWDQLIALNDDLYDKHRDASYSALRGALVASHGASVASMCECSEAELTEVGAFAWLPNTTMAIIANECLAAHYDWAIDVLDRAQLA